MNTYYTPFSAGVTYLCPLRTRLIAAAVTCVLMLIVFAGLPAGNSPSGGMLSTATSAIAPSNAHAFIRFTPSGFNRWLQFRSRRPIQWTPDCFFNPSCGQLA